MRPRVLVGALVLLILATFSGRAEAAPVHYFDCKLCHAPNVNIATLGNGVTNLCLKCHKPSPPGTDFLAGGPTGVTSIHQFTANDASNAMGSAPAGFSPTLQTSHYWASPTDVVPAAGASAPTQGWYKSRYAYSSGKVTCGRCHDPHGDKTTSPQLLRYTAGADAMCLDCHVSRYKNEPHAPGTHPIVADYETIAAANPTKFKPMAEMVDLPGEMTLLPGNKISCTTCHGVHFADSNSDTIDGPGTAGTGDGMMLKANGPGRTDPDSAIQAQMRSDLCQACHVYKVHGNSSKIGCLDCHGGHAYDSANPTLPNYYILKPSIGPFKTATADWFNGDGNGFCQGCHTVPVDGAGKHMGLAAGGQAACGECHNHANSDVSFGGACNSCHGYPPIADTASGKFGYAVQPNAPAGFVNGYKYLDGGTTLRDVYKNEVNTPHAAHAAGEANYKFPCQECHIATYPVDLATHANQSFQDVAFGEVAKKDGLNPNYNGTPDAGNDGICASVYCHSNGGPRGAAPQVATIPAWENGSVAGAINGCDSCHGGDVATMTTKANSVAHLKHVAKYSCNYCHNQTAKSNTQLSDDPVDGILGDTHKHVNGNAEVSFDGTILFGSAELAGTYGSDGSCQTVYCHSNGRGNHVTPDWDNTGADGDGACGTCHQAVAADDPGPALGGSHAKHVFDANGPKLACSVCHTSAHIDGQISKIADLQTTVCNICHAVESGETVPFWGAAATVDCNTCHGGATQSTFTTPAGTFDARTLANAKTSFLESGHGLASGQYPVTGKNAAAKVCTSCHNKDAAGHFDADGDLRLIGDYSNKNAFCATCHGAIIKTHQDTKQCIACHDPHGTANIAMIYRSQSVQNAKDTSGTGKFSGDVVFTAFLGADSFDELDGIGSNTDDICATCHTTTSHNNRVTDPATEHTSGDKRGTNCILCHQHPKEFLPVGNSCKDCHGNAPDTGAHTGPNGEELHFTKDGDTSAEDRSDCAYCHTGADDYTYSPGDDRANGLNHGKPDGRKTLLTASVGYSDTNQNCTKACHKSAAAGDGAWNDANGLNCDACHYHAAAPTSDGNNAYPALDGGPLSVRHDKHFTAALICANCHGTPDAQGVGPLPHKHAKAIDATGDGQINDADWLKTQGKTYLNPGGADVNVDDSVLNAGGGNSWVAADNTCSTRMCHDPSGAGKVANWGQTNSQTCQFCHNYNPTYPATGSHPAHVNVDAIYGSGIGCAKCHTTNYTMSHRNGKVDFTGTFYSGDKTDFSDSTWGTCDTSTCHNNGKRMAPAVTVTWGTAREETCALCHAATPTTDDHTVHLSGTYGPALGTNCGTCHWANGNNTSMAGYALHMTGDITFRNAAGTSYQQVGTGMIGDAAGDAIDICNACHGGATAALTAKDYWKTTARVSCGSCHGDYTPAVIGGVTAPNTAGAYGSFGHGKTGVAKACADCHDSNVAHISASSGDTNRLKDISGVSYGSNPNGYCEVCHNTAAFDPNIHYTNAQTAGGASVDGNQCNICHNPHGASGLDAMVRNSIGGKTVAGFTDSAARSSYFLDPPNSGANAGKYGICQVCHDPAEVGDFNRTTANDSGHNSGSVCISCHTHQNTNMAFQASCNGCHGSTSTGQYWPSGVDGSIPTADQAGRHDKHVLAIGQRLGYGDFNVTMYTAAQQKAICAYCHDTPGTDTDHGKVASLPADVNSFYAIWDLSRSTLDDGSYSSPNATPVGNDTCSNVNCHNNRLTAIGDYGWYNIKASACAMCHAADVTTTGTHNEHLRTGSIYFNNGRIGCTSCHAAGTAWATTPPSVNHINGAMNATADYNPAAKTCGTNDCHNDGKGSAPAVTPTWGVANSADCNFCHTNSGEGHNGHFAAYNTILIADGIPNCTSCHTHDGPNAAHFDGTVSLLAGMGYTSGRVTVGDGLYGTCTTSVCHTDGKGNQVPSPTWNTTGDACVICHSVSTNGVPSTGSHTQHVQGNPVIFSYTAQGLTTTQTEYKFNCTACHGSTLGNHMNDTANVLASVNYNSVGDTCVNNACHNNGKGAGVGNDANLVANWTTGWVSELDSDQCNNCHGNSPTTGAHDVHGVGIHTSDTYTGTTGLLASGNTEPSAHGVAATSTVIGCNTCHNATVDVWYNDQGSACRGCHNGTTATLRGNMAIKDKTKHVNSATNMAFQNIQLKTKAQIRDDIGSVPELANTWNRVSAYKAANQYDQAKASLGGITVTGSKTCQNVACHNGIETQAWTTAPASRNGCMACHTQLP